MPTLAMYAKPTSAKLGDVFVDVGRGVGLQPTEQRASAAAAVTMEAGHGAAVTNDEEIQGAADELVTDWLQGGSGGGFDEEELEEGLARDLLDLDDAKRRATSLCFAVVRASRTAPFLSAIARGERVELVTVGGRRGAKLKMADGSSRIAILDGDELAELEAAFSGVAR